MRSIPRVNKLLASVTAACVLSLAVGLPDLRGRALDPGRSAPQSTSARQLENRDGPRALGKGMTSAEESSHKKSNLTKWLLIGGAAAVVAIVAVLLLTKSGDEDSSGTEGEVTVTSFGGSGSVNGKFGQPYGLAIDSSGNVYVTDTQYSTIQKFTQNGVFVKKWDFTPGVFPMGLVAFQNKLYVCDLHGNGIRIFDLEGNYQGFWSLPDTNTQRSNPGPVDIDVDAGGNFYVLDAENLAVIRLNSSGAVLGTFRVDVEGKTWGPLGIAYAGGYVFITESDHNKVMKWDVNGTLIKQWGETGSGNGQFSIPTGISAVGGNALLVGDFNAAPTAGRVQKFDLNGGFLSVRNPETGNFYPRSIAVNETAKKIYLCHSNDDRILVFDIF
jgi:DNA-binding beta-propeller fold protein YncE